MCAAAEAREGIIRAGGGAMFRADAKRRCFASWDGELRAGAALRLAGFSSGWRDCARGGCSAERCGSRAGAVFVLLRSCGSIGMSCARSRPSYVPIGMSYARSRLLFAALRQTERLAICSVPVPPWVGIAIRAFSMAVRLSDLVGSFRACAFLYGDPDGVTKRRRNAGDAENGVGGAV